MKSWHFTSDTLRDGSPIPAVGQTLKHVGPLVACESGLHASVRAIDALQYAPGSMIHRVELSGEKLSHGDPVDKWVATERTILWSADATDTLRRFARMCALDVIHLWEAPDIVVEYLKTGDESKRAAAWAAARDVAWAARAAAWAAARDAAWAARTARAAAGDAAGDKQNRRLAKMLNKLRDTQ